ncbi:MAG TPA: helix-turn-helix domain-containing protein, partial [Bacteroidota bacterium]|nr:helix-turn-helix domain-containing protein [Bacteroidota bacterium]
NIPIPPLRERREDIPLLAKEFLRAVGAKNGIPINGITDEAMELLRQYDWPGNVRELKNVLESMVVVEGGKKIDETIVRKFIRGVSGNGHNYLPVSTRKTPEQAERELIYRALLEVKSDILDIKRMLSHDGVSGAFETHRGIPTNVIEADVASEPHESSDHVSLNDMERKLIASALEHHKGNRRLASKQLKISERTLYRKIKEYGLEY